MGKPIRIAQIVGKMNGGGVESFLMNYYNQIDKSKYQFDFIVDSDSKLIPKQEIESLGGKVIIVSPYQHIFKYIKDLRRIFKQNNYSIVHAHLNSLSVFPLFCAYKCKIPVRIAHSHSTGNKKEGIRYLIKIVLKNFSKVFSTHYFACTEHAGIWLFGRRTFNKGKITLVKNAINIKKFEFDETIRKDIRKELKIESKFVLGHVGRFMQQKNHEFLIDIFRKIHQFDKETALLLIGNGPLEEKIKEKVYSFGLKKSVFFLGQKYNVNNYLNAMDVFVFPSLYEGLGIVVIEAQANNLPCICSNMVPAETNITGKIDFLNLRSNFNEWYKAIKKYKQNNRSDKSNRVDLNNFSSYNIDKQVVELEKKYDSLLKEINNVR